MKLVGASRRTHRRPALWLVLAFMGGLAVGRAVSLLVDGPPGPFVLRLWIPEALAGGVAGALLWAGRRQNGNHPT